MKSQQRILNKSIGVLVVLVVAVSAYVGAVETNMIHPGSQDVLGDTDVSPYAVREYYNEGAGYTLYYPTAWVRDDKTSADVWIRSSAFYFDFLNNPQVTSGEAQAAIRLVLRDNPSRLSVNEWLAQQEDLPKFVTRETSLDSGAVVVGAVTQSESWKARETYFVQMSERVLEMSFYSNNENLAQVEVEKFQRALNTLTLAESKTEVTTETYQNGAAGFLVDFRSDFIPEGEDYDRGFIAFKSTKKGMRLEAEYVSPLSDFGDLSIFAKSREEAKFIDAYDRLDINDFPVLRGRFKADTTNTYYYVKTSRGYFVLRAKLSQLANEETKQIVTDFLESLRVYELASTADWTRYTSADGVFSFIHPADASITNVVNGVELDVAGEVGDVTMGMYRYDNLGLSVAEWVDNRQLNKYKGADTKHFLFSVKSRVSGLPALRVVDSVGEMKIVTYAVSPASAFVVDLRPFDSSNAEALMMFNTVLDSLIVQEPKN